MVVRCLKCKARLTVPDDRAGSPGLKLKCPGCGLVFPLDKAPKAYAIAKPSRAESTGPIPDAPSSKEGPGPFSPDAAASLGDGVVTHPGPPAVPPATPLAAKASWLWCVTHPTVRSVAVCVTCAAGYCRDCGKRVQTATLCPRCEGLCVPAVLAEEEAAKRERIQKPLLSRLDTILAYPLSDPIAFLLLALFIWLLGNAQLLGAMLSQAILMAYTFQALMRASQGRYSFAIPEITGPLDLIQPLLLGVAVSIVSYGPPLFVLLWSWGEVGPVSILLRVLLVAPWTLFYTPMALTVAAMSQSVLQTLQPWLGIGAMQRMGRVYFQALAITLGLTVVRWGVTVPFYFVPIPFVGGIVGALVGVYCSLATGCAMGIAVEKKAVELGLE